MSSSPEGPRPPSDNKYSRYRAVRRAAAAPEPPPAVEDAPMAARSMSRYRRTRPRPESAQEPPPPPSLSHRHEAPAEDPFKTPPASRKASHHTRHDVSSPDSSEKPSPTLPPPLPTSRPWADASSPDGPPDREAGVRQPPERQRTREEAAVDARRRIEESRRMPHARGGDRPQRRDEQAGELQRGLQPVQAPISSPETSPRKERFAFLSRRKTRDSPPPPSSSGPARLPSPPEAGIGIEPGGGGIVPGIDAPVSAVNAGERRVKIRYEESVINLPVNPDTTALDLIFAATAKFREPIKPEACILVEAFTQVGLERPLRHYEHVRDVMNSWDRDTQNGLVLMPSPSGGAAEDLEEDHVPREPASELSVFMYYSQKPGKWDKRWITLRPDGQMFVAKKAGAKDKDVTNICHLSDFDVYAPTKRQAKELKISKKVCFAVKSQQRSSMFLSTANFVHFVATEDRALAAEWYRAVQGWRSRYLFNKLGDRPRASQANRAMQGSGKTGSRGSQGASRPGTASKETSYELGSFKPLFSSEDLESARNIKGEATSRSREAHAQRLSQRERRAPPVSFPNKLTKDRSSGQQQGEHIIRGESPERGEEGTFAPTGLLGRTYSQRQQQQRERDLTARQDGPFVNGPNLLNGTGASSGSGAPHSVGARLSGSQSIRTRHDSAPRARSGSGQPKPLIDFSNAEYREAPQFMKKGRGYVPEKPPRGGLVDVATTPEVAIAIPPATNWRRPTTAGGRPPTSGGRPSTSGGSPTHGRTKTLSRSHAQEPQDPFADGGPPPEERDEDGFSGLLAGEKVRKQGWTGRGRGVMTGDRHAKGPMLDMSETSRFAPGSLLARTSEGQASGPVIDRERHDDVRVGVGEGAR
ncbi:MAG: hypothetical protein M1832_002882 [Thelocarpon impressellum]|nr:MAG: hypothetical protein M1832_002882 [Thelocarpon impressellum]